VTDFVPSLERRRYRLAVIGAPPFLLSTALP